MSSYILEFLAWKASGSSDKVWGYFTAGGERYTFWGARRSKLTYKEFPLASLEPLRKGREKVRSGYHSVSIDDVERATPGFREEFEKNFIMDKMFERLHGQ